LPADEFVHLVRASFLAQLICVFPTVKRNERGSDDREHDLSGGRAEEVSISDDTIDILGGVVSAEIEPSGFGHCSISSNKTYVVEGLGEAGYPLRAACRLSINWMGGKCALAEL